MFSREKHANPKHNLTPRIAHVIDIISTILPRHDRESELKANLPWYHRSMPQSKTQSDWVSGGNNIYRTNQPDIHL